MTTEEQLDETQEEDVQEDQQQEEEVPQFFTREEVLAEISKAKAEAEEGAFRRAQTRMEGELNSQKDRRFNDLQRQMADIQTSISTRDRSALIAQATEGLDENQQRAMTALLESQPSATPNPSQVVEQTVQQPQTLEQQGTVALIEAHVSKFGIQAKWGDNNPVWNDLTSDDPAVFEQQLNKNIVQVLQTPAQPPAAPRRRADPPPVVTRQSAAPQIRTADQLMDAHISGKITPAQYEERKAEFGITT